MTLKIKIGFVDFLAILAARHISRANCIETNCDRHEKAA